MGTILIPEDDEAAPCDCAELFAARMACTAGGRLENTSFFFFAKLNEASSVCIAGAKAGEACPPCTDHSVVGGSSSLIDLRCDSGSSLFLRMSAANLLAVRKSFKRA